MLEQARVFPPANPSPLVKRIMKLHAKGKLLAFLLNIWLGRKCYRDIHQNHTWQKDTQQNMAGQVDA